jgi:spermidine dehydrogenase
MKRDFQPIADDRALGMNVPIARRDFLNGARLALAGTLAGGLPLSGAAAWAAGETSQERPGYYPPALTGLRGSHPGSFEFAHSLRDGNFWSQPRKVTETGEVYDLVVVGGGISGLAAAHFYRRQHDFARVLVLDNHDDFGGHAKRNEFRLGDRLALINGGTIDIDIHGRTARWRPAC